MNFLNKINNLKRFSEIDTQELEKDLAELLKKKDNFRKLSHVNKDVQKRLGSLVKRTQSAFEGRKSEAEVVVAGLASGVSVVLLGPPGTAKSALVRQVANLCGLSSLTGKYFEYLLTNHTMPEEIFGGPNVEELMKGKVVRETKDKLPEAEIAFLDELFRGGSHILNTLLTIINEKRYDSGKGAQHVPLLGLIGAANSAPLDPELEAFFDRFPVRAWVDSVLEPRTRFEQIDPKTAQRLANFSIAKEITRLQTGWDSKAAVTSIENDMVSCTNDIRFVRVFLLKLLEEAKTGAERFIQFEKLFRSLKDRCKLSDRAFGQLWLFGSALDYVRGNEPLSAYPQSNGHVEVFLHIGRSRRDLPYLRERVDSLTRGTGHSGVE